MSVQNNTTAARQEVSDHVVNMFAQLCNIQAQEVHKHVAEFNSKWNVVRDGLQQILNDERVTSGAFMTMFSNVCALNNLSLVEVDYDVTTGRDVYNYCVSFMVDAIRNQRNAVVGLSGLELLQRYGKMWRHYAFALTVINDVFSHTNRNYVKHQVDQVADTDVMYIHKLCHKVWQTELLASIETSLINAVYEQIVLERNGGRIDTTLIQDVLDSLVQMGINDPAIPKIDQSGHSLLVYEDSFESVFLANTKQDYIIEAQQFLQGNNIIDYMKRVTQRIKEEEERVELYLQQSTHPKLQEVIDQAMIIEYIDRFRAEFDNMLEHDEVENLKHMYTVVRRVEDGLTVLHEKLEAHMVQKGGRAISVLTSGPVDPKVYVNTILNFHKHYDNIVSASFSTDPGFVKYFDTAMTKIVNTNAITKLAKSSAKTSELLARYCDFLLRKSPKSLPEAEIEDCLEQSMIFFKYIEDKDVFQKIYTSLLAKRIVHDASASDDFEASMLAKLKKMCGFEYVAKLQRIFQDQTISKEMTASFKKAESHKLGFDLSVLVSAKGVWPLNSQDCEIPRCLQLALTEFQQFYTAKHTGRTLNYMNNLGRGEVVCHQFARKYSFIVNTPQLTVLTMFNDGDAYTLQQIMDTLKLEREALPNILVAMLKIELLKLEGGVSFSPNTPLDTKVELNMKFTSRKMKIDLSKGTARTESKKEEAEVAQDVAEDRRMIIQAAIVRVMKMRKTSLHNALIAEVIKQLSNRFKPDIRMIKKCIDELIDKEYLARTEENRECYEYLS